MCVSSSAHVLKITKLVNNGLIRRITNMQKIVLKFFAFYAALNYNEKYEKIRRFLRILCRTWKKCNFHSSVLIMIDVLKLRSGQHSRSGTRKNVVCLDINFNSFWMEYLLIIRLLRYCVQNWILYSEVTCYSDFI